MTNILPEHHKEEHSRELRARSVFTGALILSSAIIIGGILLAPALIYVQYSLSTIKTQRAHVENSIQLLQEESVEGVLEELQRRVAILKTQENVSVEGYLESIVHARPFGILVDQLSYNASAESIQLSGFAESRNALIEFVDMLQKVPEFNSASVPVQNLSKERDITFSIQITLLSNT